MHSIRLRPAGDMGEEVRSVGEDVHRRAGFDRSHFAAEGESTLALEQGEHLLEVMAMRFGPTTMKDVPIDLLLSHLLQPSWVGARATPEPKSYTAADAGRAHEACRAAVLDTTGYPV